MSTPHPMVKIIFITENKNVNFFSFLLATYPNIPYNKSVENNK